MPSAATKESLSQADIILNRTNVALARSQRLIQSWLPPKPHQDQPAAAADEREQEDDDDFRGDSEVGGIGSSAQRATDDSGLPEGAFKRRNPGANDKLLDSLLGKKAANAHRKAQALAKSAASGTGGGGRGAHAAQSATSKPSAKEPQKKRSAQDDSDSEEEESGRAAAFKSKRPKPSAPPLRRTPEDSVESGGANADGAEDGEPGQEAEGGLEAPRETTTAAAAVKSGGGGGRKRPASYLDELLGQKANKKSKKKKKTAG